MLGPPDLLIYRVNNLDVDSGRGCILRDGQEVPLKPKAFRVLVHLLKERHRLVSKEELLELFWTDTAVTDEALTQCIARLRRVLGDDPKNPTYLKTIPRMGYRFVGEVQEILPGVSAIPAVPPPAEPEPESELAQPEETRAPRARRFRWMVAGALAFGLLTAAVLWIGTSLHFPVPAVHANRLSQREPDWWEVAWWKLNEGRGSKISDSIHGLTATLPAEVSWTQGVSGPALLFTGRPLVVSGGDPGFLPANEKPRTLVAWIKTATSTGDTAPILGYNDPKSGEAGYSLVMQERGKAGFGAPVHYYLLGKQRIDDGRWHQVTGVFEGLESRRMRLFVDGAEEVTATPPSFHQSPEKSVQWTIGSGSSVGNTFRGAIDDVRVYERTLRADEIRSLYHCMAGGNDLDVEGLGSFYFAPIYGDHADVTPRAPGEPSSRVRNTGKDFGGVMFVRREPDCGLRSIHGADMGQDLNMEVELRLPPGPGDALSDGGLYFRSRKANPGDGIIGGTSAGYWVRLDSTGQVRVSSLNPGYAFGLSAVPQGFDANVFHKLEAAVHGETLEVALDGHPLTFDSEGVQRKVLQLSPAWENTSPKGSNGGSAGIVFSCTANRWQAGGQEARNIRVQPYHPLRTN